MSDTMTAVGLPRLNAPAPPFSAKTTQGDRALTDYRGKWLVLFSQGLSHIVEPAHPSGLATRAFI